MCYKSFDESISKTSPTVLGVVKCSSYRIDSRNSNGPVFLFGYNVGQGFIIDHNRIVDLELTLAAGGDIRGYIPTQRPDQLPWPLRSLGHDPEMMIAAHFQLFPSHPLLIDETCKDIGVCARKGLRKIQANYCNPWGTGAEFSLLEPDDV